MTRRFIPARRALAWPGGAALLWLSLPAQEPTLPPAPDGGASEEPAAVIGAGTPAAGRQPVAIEDLVGRNWKLAAARDGAGQLDPAAAGQAITLVILAPVDGRVRLAGQSAVNRYFASATSEEAGQVRFDAVGGTEMAGPQPAMELETRYYALLGAATGIALDGNDLILSSDAGELRFVPDAEVR